MERSPFLEPTNVIEVPSRNEGKTWVELNLGVLDHQGILTAVREVLIPLEVLENRIDELEKTGYVGTIWRGVVGKDQQELFVVINNLNQAKQKAILRILNLAAANKRNKVLMNEILLELSKARSIPIRTTSKARILYDQVVMFRDGIREYNIKKILLDSLVMGVIAVISIAIILSMAYFMCKLIHY